MSAFFNAFWSDDRVAVMLLLIALDIVLGVLVAVIIQKNFRLSYVADFLRNDVLGKVLPFSVIYAGYIYANNAEIIIPGVDLEIIMNGSWVIVLASLVGSLLGSLKELKIWQAAPAVIAGPDPASPVIPPSP